MKPDELERVFLTLTSGDPDELLTDVRTSRSAPLLQYARNWISLVAQEFRSDLSEVLKSPPKDTARSSRTTSRTRASSRRESSSCSALTSSCSP